MMKKAIAPVVSYVLLIGFAVILAVIVSVWSKSFVQENTEEPIQTIEGELLCRDVRINVAYTSGCTSMNISNNGFVTIEKFSVNKLSPTVSSSIEETTLAPYNSFLLSSSSINSVEIVPIVKVKNSLIGCADKKFFIKDCND